MITGTQFLYIKIRVYFSFSYVEFKKMDQKNGGGGVYDVSRACFNQNIPDITSVICDMHT